MKFLASVQGRRDGKSHWASSDHNKDSRAKITSQMRLNLSMNYITAFVLARNMFPSHKQTGSTAKYL